VRRLLPPLLVALALAVLLAACGAGEGAAPGGRGRDAHLWVTQNQGADVVLDTTVPAGLNAIAALDREAEIETRYGGRFVQSVNGVEGSLTGQRDWFYFVNGIEPDVGGADVKLRPGDVVWWDFREWGGEREPTVVVGAFPDPFVHGWDGKRRPAEVRAPAELSGEAAELLATLGGSEGEGEPNVFAVEIDEDAEGATLTAERGAANGAPVTFKLVGSFEAVGSVMNALVTDPGQIQFSYTARFDDEGQLLE
jgi:hypothetical protein